MNDDSGDDCAPEDATFCVIEDINYGGYWVGTGWVLGGYWNVNLTQFEKANVQ
jgi:hypothetical protein